MNSFCKMIGQLLQTGLDPLTTVSYTASACSSELTASVVSWTASALKCTQQTTRCKKSQATNEHVCNQVQMICIEIPKLTKTLQSCASASFGRCSQISTQPTGEPRDTGSILPIKLDSICKQAAKLPKPMHKLPKGAHTSIRGLRLVPCLCPYFGRKTSGRRRW